MRQGEARGGGLAVTGIVLMQLGGNGGASRSRFPLVAFEGGLSESAYSESVLRLAGPALPTGSTRRPAQGRVLTRNVIESRTALSQSD